LQLLLRLLLRLLLLLGGRRTAADATTLGVALGVVAGLPVLLLVQLLHLLELLQLPRQLRCRVAAGADAAVRGSCRWGSRRVRLQGWRVARRPRRVRLRLEERLRRGAPEGRGVPRGVLPGMQLPRWVQLHGRGSDPGRHVRRQALQVSAEPGREVERADAEAAERVRGADAQRQQVSGFGRGFRRRVHATVERAHFPWPAAAAAAAA
jgi:hypothetical protein